ncbi:MAG: transglutaminase domain-containing protein [Bdellovibrionales bacterium]|nr:transglutaminase domain-containing protein [Bdellovibrionales bacterium]
MNSEYAGQTVSAERAYERAERSKFLQLQTLRALLAAILTLFVAHAADVGVATGWLLVAVMLGVVAAGILLRRGYRFWHAAVAHIIVFALFQGLFAAVNWITTASPEAPQTSDFQVALYADDFFLVFFFYVVSFFLTWSFWTLASAVTWEAVAFSSLVVWLLSGHRDYQIDAPKELSSLTWKVGFLQQLHAEPQHLLLIIGGIFIGVLSAYLVLANNRPLFGRERVLRSYGPTQKGLAIACPLLLVVALVYYARYLNSHYSADLSRVTNGVGNQENLKEGESNLGFHSAISPTKQPAALVRLEGDYADNPWEPMLYFREGALSTFNGQELVLAGPNLDTDVPNVLPGQPYLSLEDEPGPNREKVVQSVYLLTDHKAPFALDIPRRITMIKNPYPERFQLAYQAVSHAPVANVQELMGAPVGDPAWTKETWDHYLRAPGSRSVQAELSEHLLEQALHADKEVVDENGEDLRYLALAKAITGAHRDKVMKAAAIVQFLSDNSVYTKQPGHQVSASGDPVAPYLFAERKRGYCVHFAHAAAYLMRLVGIPARIATGYLVDLSYAKDGHILLSLGDRHAWPEVYVENHGWMVFDVTPAEAEGEQTLVPDEKLLDELMGKLDPVQELLEPVPVDVERSDRSNILVYVLTSQNALFALVLLVLTWTTLKWWLRNGYRFAGDEATRIKRGYIAFASLMSDGGLPRQVGETRSEYAQRLHRRYGIDAQAITKAHEVVKYGGIATGLGAEVSQALAAVRVSYDSAFSRFRRAALFFSPLSIGRWRRW